ncbi:MAG: FtsL-like putative cell division protein [Chitinophagales bacterium]
MNQLKAILRQLLLPLLRLLEKADFSDRAFLTNNLRYVLFVSCLVLVYIANNHYAERKRLEIGDLQKELKELRWEYLTTKSEFMQQCKQSEIVKMVSPMGLNQLKAPPQKLIVQE